MAGLKIVGIDASLTSTGVAVLEDGEITTMAIQSKKTGVDRLIEIREEVYRMVSGADLVCIEDYAYAKQNQAHQIGELGGVLRVLMHEAELKWVEVAPTAVKKFATGKGVADKREMAVEVFKRWGIDRKTSDEVDAYVLVRIGESYVNRPAGLPGFQREVIAVLRGEAGTPKTKKKAAK